MMKKDLEEKMATHSWYISVRKGR